MIMYIRQSENIKFLHKAFNIFKVEKLDDKTIINLPIERLITVFGCGGNRDKTKRREMCDVALNFSDLVIVTTDNPRYENPELIIDDIVRGVVSEKLVRITDRKSAIEYAMQIANENDLVAILGKGAENYQEIKGVKFPYSDFEVVNNCNKYSLKGKIKA